MELLLGAAFLSYSPSLTYTAEYHNLNWRPYEVLIAVERCDLVGQEGWLIIDRPYRTLVVDCQAGHHKPKLSELDLLGDVDRTDLVHKRAWLVISKYRSWLMSKQCTFDDCKDRAIAGFYSGTGHVDYACPQHFEEINAAHDPSVPFILDNTAEEMIDTMKEMGYVVERDNSVQ